MSEMHEVMGGCKICGRRTLTNGSPLVRRTCDACKAIKKRERNRRTYARRKAARRAVKAKIAPPRCEQCGKPIEGANLLATRAGPQWARKFCGNTCRKAAFRTRFFAGSALL
jgi:ferredoxin